MGLLDSEMRALLNVKACGSRGRTLPGLGRRLSPRGSVGLSSLEEGAVPSTARPGKDSHPREESRQLELAEDQ